MPAETTSIRPTEARHEAAVGLHALDPCDTLERMRAAQLSSLQCLTNALPALAQAAERAAASLQDGGRLGYAGAGSSGLMALADCLELAGTYGISPAQTPILFAGGIAALRHMTGDVEDDPARAEADFAQAGLVAGDTVICVSASGRTPYTLAVVRRARASGVTVIGVANVTGAPLLEIADIKIALETGAEFIAGSTRMAAGSAQKIALNMLSTQIGILLGHVHDGYMVNLHADNDKLRTRALEMVAAIAKVDQQSAARALDAATGAVKPAVLIAAGATLPEAHTLIAQSGGHLSHALELLKP